MGSHEQVFMGFESQAVSAQVAKQFVTTFTKTCNKMRVLESKI